MPYHNLGPQCAGIERLKKKADIDPTSVKRFDLFRHTQIM
jgi:hypothetical protein